jgi:two-component system, NarL family, response regulator YdfI
VIRVLVAARRATARARLEAVVAGAPALRLVPAMASVPVARQLEELRPDLVLLDLEDDRLETALGGPEGAGGVPLIVVAEEPHRVMTEEPLGRGPVRAVLPRDASAGELLAAIAAVGAGLVALHPDALRRAPRPMRAEPDPGQPLTVREVEVLGMLAEGLGNKAIASRLGISTHTAKFHVASILSKLSAGSRTEAVTIGMRRGLVAI